MNTSKLKALFEQSTDKYGDAQKMGTTYQNINRIIKGDVDIRVSTLEKIARFYKLPVAYFFDETTDGQAAQQLEIERLKGQIQGLKDAIAILRNTPTVPGGSPAGKKPAPTVPGGSPAGKKNASSPAGKKKTPTPHHAE